MKCLVGKELVNIVITNPRKYETSRMKLRAKYQIHRSRNQACISENKSHKELHGNLFKHLHQNCCTSSSRNTPIVPWSPIWKIRHGMN
jgi:hypothetical protein